MDAADRPERDHGGMRRAARLLLSAARSRQQVHLVLPSDHCVGPGRTARAACLQPEPECLCGALGQVGEGGVPVQGPQSAAEGTKGRSWCAIEIAITVGPSASRAVVNAPLISSV